MSLRRRTRALLTENGGVLIEQPDGSFPLAEGQTNWQRVRAMTDEEALANAASDPDAPPLDDDFFRTARRVRAPASSKSRAGPRIDADVLDWFRAQGRDWQARMNAVLRAYVEAQKHD